MIIPPHIQFKSNDLLHEYQQISPRLQVILEDMAKWVNGNGYEFVITDLLSELSEDKKLNRVSSSHRDGRAADVRVRSWPLEFRNKFENYFETKYYKWAAISSTTGKPNLILIHDNSNGIHCHVQVKQHKEGYHV